MTLREVLALQRETVLIAVTMTALIVVFSGGRSGILQTGLITVIYASIAGNMVRFAVPVVARRLASLPQPQGYLALLLAFGLIGVVAGSVATLVLFGVSEAFGLFTRGQTWLIGRNGIELSVLVSVIAGVIGTMSAEKRAALEATVEGQQEEFARAKEIQLGLLPKTLPVLAGYTSAGHWQPARMIGGDYYDLWRIDEDHAGLCIADVSGKGAAAALLMANLQAAVRVTATTPFSPADLCGRLNTVLRANIGRGKFVTLFVAMLDLRSGTLVHANAGHNAPLLRRAGGDVEELGTTGPALGIIAGPPFGERRVVLAPGDRLLLFTDGLPEAGADRTLAFDESRIATHLHTAATPHVLLDALAAEVTAVSGAALHDDLTMLALYRE